MNRLAYALARCSAALFTLFLINCAAPGSTSRDLHGAPAAASPQASARASDAGPAPENLTALPTHGGQGPCQVTTQGERRETTMFQYDEKGRVLQQTLDLGHDGQLDQTTITQRDAAGRPVTRVRHDGDGPAGEVVQTTSWRYDDQGRVVVMRVDEGGKLREVRTTYGEDGLPSLIEGVAMPSGEAYMRIDIARDGDVINERVDMNGDGEVDEVRVTTLDDQGRPARMEQSGPVWPLKQWRTFEYNEAGQLTRDTAGEGGATLGDRVTTHSYDDRGRRAHSRIDSDRDGQPNVTITFDYSCHP